VGDLPFAGDMSYDDGMSDLTIHIPEKLRRDIEKLSRAKRQPVDDLIRDSIRRYIAVERFRALRQKTKPLAKAQGFLTDEDVFKAIS
jgi:hypothetical protein